MIWKNTRIILFIFLLVPPALAGAQTDEVDRDYTIDEISHSFGIMEEYVIYDEIRKIVFDLTNAMKNPNISQLDVKIALDFAAHNNELMEALYGSVGRVDELGRDPIKQALDSYVNGRFKAVFDGESEPGESTGEIRRTSYNPNQITAIFTPDITQATIYPVRSHQGGSMLACGGSQNNPHNHYDPIDDPPKNEPGFSSAIVAKNWALANGYHNIYWPFSSVERGLDFSRTDTTAPEGCNSGQFREQAVMADRGTEKIFRTQHDEPNPELHTYWWPKI